MGPDQAVLEKFLRAGDVDGVAAFFEKATEARPRPFATQVIDWCRLLELNWRAEFSKPAGKKLAALEKIKGNYYLMPAAYAAALACASLAQIKSIGFFGRPPDNVKVAILHARRPVWLDEFGEFLCEGEMRRGSASNWRILRALVRAKLCRPPLHPNYALGALIGVWPPSDSAEDYRRPQAGEPPAPEPSLVDLLLAERDWLGGAFWRLFELDGTGEVSLANCERYGKSRQSWTEAIVELSRRGVLSRDQLLDASLDALSRDFIQFRSGWFGRFHEALAPTPQERAIRVGAYLNLLGSAIPPTVAFAVEAASAADGHAPLRAAKLLPALRPALGSTGKSTVKTAVGLLDRLAIREPAAKPDICLAAIEGLLSEAAESQKEVFALLERHGDRRDAKLRARVAEVAGAVAASLRKRLEPWLDPKSKVATGVSPVVETPVPKLNVFRITDPSRAVPPLEELDDLLHQAGVVLEEPKDPQEIERVLDGISRLCDRRPAGFEERAGPLRKRSLKKRDAMDGEWPRHPPVERALAMVFLSWITREDSFREEPLKMAGGQNRFAFLNRRLRALARQAAHGFAMPLLSAPTHAGSWIEAGKLVERWLAWQRAGVTPDPHEQVLALLRLAPEKRETALDSANALGGEPGEALRFALGGGLVNTGGDAALWLAAWRSRVPDGDLPEFERAHPGLGPDAGIAARYTWAAWEERLEGKHLNFPMVRFRLDTQPRRPAQIGDTLLPVLLHGERESSEDDQCHLIRWGAYLWPAQREALYAAAAARLEGAVDYRDARDDEMSPYLEPLGDPNSAMGPMACVALALGLAAEEPALRGHAQEGLIAAITEGRINAPELGATMARLLDSRINKLARWGKSLREVSRVSPAHVRAAADLLQRALRGDPARAPRDVGILLEALLELLGEASTKIEDPKTRDYLARLPGGGKSAKLAKQILAL